MLRRVRRVAIRTGQPIALMVGRMNNAVRMTRIAIVGDFNPEYETHHAINRSLGLAGPMPDRSAGAPNLHGAATIRLRRGTRAWEIYGRDEVSERYFCNYEVNPAYREALEAAGLALSGFSASRYAGFTS